MADYQFQQFGVAIEMAHDRIHRRMDEAYNAARRQMNINMYGEPEVRKPLTLLQRIQRGLALYVSRVRDAWLVLTGKAELYDGY